MPSPAERRQRCPDFASILRETDDSAAVHDQVVECFYTEMSRTARARCGDAELAQDAIQDAMSKSLEVLDSFRGDAPLEHWLRRLVVSACSRLRRGRKNDPRQHVGLEHAEEVLVDDDGPEWQLMLRERVDILGEVLSQVDEPNRSLLLLHEGQDEPIAELAERFTLSAEAVKARLKRTRALVRAELLARAQEDLGG